MSVVQKVPLSKEFPQTLDTRLYCWVNGAEEAAKFC